MKDSTGQLVTDDSGMADLLYEFFCSVFTREDSSSMPIAEQLFNLGTEYSLDTVQFSEAIVQKKLVQI